MNCRSVCSFKVIARNRINVFTKISCRYSAINDHFLKASTIFQKHSARRRSTISCCISQLLGMLTARNCSSRNIGRTTGHRTCHCQRHGCRASSANRSSRCTGAPTTAATAAATSASKPRRARTNSSRINIKTPASVNICINTILFKTKETIRRNGATIEQTHRLGIKKGLKTRPVVMRNVK